MPLKVLVTLALAEWNFYAKYKTKQKWLESACTLELECFGPGKTYITRYGSLIQFLEDRTGVGGDSSHSALSAILSEMPESHSELSSPGQTGRDQKHHLQISEIYFSQNKRWWTGIQVLRILCWFDLRDPRVVMVCQHRMWELSFPGKLKQPFSTHLDDSWIYMLSFISCVRCHLRWNSIYLNKISWYQIVWNIYWISV